MALLAMPVPVIAETPAELEALSSAAQDAQSGLALARQQISSGDLLDALSTLERMILNDPASDDARLLHASVLCRIDDRRGSLVEFGALRGHDIAEAQWSEATAPCNASGKAG